MCHSHRPSAQRQVIPAAPRRYGKISNQKAVRRSSSAAVPTAAAFHWLFRRLRADERRAPHLAMQSPSEARGQQCWGRRGPWEDWFIRRGGPARDSSTQETALWASHEWP